MRECNYGDLQHRTATSVMQLRYDRRALDCTASIPLAASLYRLNGLILHDDKVKEELASDGGLERLVAILKETREHAHIQRCRDAWNLAFQSIFFLGLRGAEQMRRRVVEADMPAVIASMLHTFITAVALCKEDVQRQYCAAAAVGSSDPGDSPMDDDDAKPAVHIPEPALLRAYEPIPLERISSSAAQAPPPVSETRPGVSPTLTGLYIAAGGNGANSDGNVRTSDQPSHLPVVPYIQTPLLDNLSSTVAQESEERCSTPYHRRIRSSQLYDIVARHFPAYKNIPHHDEIMSCLQLMAYLSKHPPLRPYFLKAYLVPSMCPLTTTGYDTHVNLFVTVEHFTLKTHPKEIQYWAAVIMRNICRRDESRGGIRQCANLTCGKWEETPRQFAKCRRCRRTKYCSKICQSRGWTGHRWWCCSAQQQQQQYFNQQHHPEQQQQQT